MSNAVGSQVANIGIGVGVPFSLYSAVRGKDVSFGQGSSAMFKLGLCLVTVVTSYAGLWVPLASLAPTCEMSETALLTRGRAVLLLSVAAAAYTGFVVAQVGEGG